MQIYKQISISCKSIVYIFIKYKKLPHPLTSQTPPKGQRTKRTKNEVNPKVWTVKHYCSFGADSDIVQDSFLLV